MRILTLVHIKNRHVGGSMVSAVDFCNKIGKKNNQQSFLIADPNNYIIKNKLNTTTTLIEYKYNKLWFIYKLVTIFKVIIDNSIDRLVTFDRQSAYLASIISYVTGKKLVPIIPGGSADTITIEPIKVKTIVFSEENKNALINKFNWPDELIEVIPARINTDNFTFTSKKNIQTPYKICLITRISESKRESFIFLLKELSKIDRETISVYVIGDGDDFERWKEISNGSKHIINYSGPKKITSHFLSNFNLVIGQGRVILESLCSGIPASICGEKGYMGIVKKDNIHTYSKTNFTGRGHQQTSDLMNDIKYLRNLSNNEMLEISKYIKDSYDNSRLVELVKKVNNNIKLIDILIMIYNILVNKIIKVFK